MENYDQDEFSQWVDMWDQAQVNGNFETEKGISMPPAQKGVDANETPQDFYWNNLDEVDDILTEGKASNPVYPDSVGKDQDHPKPAWVKENLVEEIAEMKRKLYDLEVKLGEEDAGKGEWVEKCHHPDDKNLLSQIEALHKKMDGLSNKLGLEDETPISQWEAGSDK